MTDAKTFYGAAYYRLPSEKRARLELATKYLDMACRADTDTKENMAFNAALKNEAEAFA